MYLTRFHPQDWASKQIFVPESDDDLICTLQYIRNIVNTPIFRPSINSARHLWIMWIYLHMKWRIRPIFTNRNGYERGILYQRLPLTLFATYTTAEIGGVHNFRFH